MGVRMRAVVYCCCMGIAVLGPLGCGAEAGPAASSGTETSSSSAVGPGATASSAGGESEPGGSTTEVDGVTSTGVQGTTGTTGESSLPPEEQAAQLACAAREVTEATEIPAPMANIGFAFSEYPARFLLDYAQAEDSVFEGDMWCHVISGEPGCLECECPLYDCTNWYDEEGEMRIYMVTRGIDHVEFYGGDEPLNGDPFAPLTPSVRYDVDEACPDLPQVWIPSRDENQWPVTHIVCMHHEDDLAEVAFVRLP